MIGMYQWRRQGRARQGLGPAEFSQALPEALPKFCKDVSSVKSNSSSVVISNFITMIVWIRPYVACYSVVAVLVCLF